MDRRLGGALLVVTVLAVAISVPARDGLRVAGVASMMQFPAAPRVGDCLPEAAGELLGAAETAPSRAVSSTVRWRPPESAIEVLGPRFTQCREQSAVGEVVAVITAAGDPQARHQQVQDNGPDCREAGLRYAGLVSAGDHFALPHGTADDPVIWRLSIGIHSAWIYPTPLLQAHGETWAACVISPSNATSFVGPLAKAFDGGTMPSAFGTCWNSREVSASVETVSCGEPHLAELVSAGFVPDRSTTGTEQVKSSCAELAARVTGMDDPTAGGALVIKTSPETIDTRWASQPVSILCYLVAPDRPLSRSLFGLDDQPIPYVN